MAKYIDVDGYRKLFDEEYKKTRELIRQGETHLDNLAEGFSEASRVIDSIPTADVVEITEDFETMLICAERYACGRRTYMPSTVINYIAPLIPQLSEKTLTALARDISGADTFGGWGDEYIDKPLWVQFFADIRAEIEKRRSK